MTELAIVLACVISPRAVDTALLASSVTKNLTEDDVNDIWKQLHSFRSPCFYL